LNDEEVFSNIIPDYQRNKKENPEYVERLNELIKMYSKNFIVRYLMVQNFEIRLGVHLSEEKEKEKQKIMSDFVGKYAAASLSPKDYRRFNDSICVSRKG
jgi:hypothetical protein